MTHAMTSTSAENATLPLAEEIVEQRLSGLWPCPTCKAALPDGSRNWGYMRRTGYCSYSCHERAQLSFFNARMLSMLDPKQHTEPRKGME